jgi:hypothetical protein
MSYFKVGEECILQSVRFPELNGECVVNEVLAPKVRTFHLANGETIITNRCAYRTTIENPNDWAWAEPSLRKKHKPSTESLSTMIAKLNVKSKVESK